MKRSLASAILLSFSVILSAQITFPVNDIRDPDASLVLITNVQIHQDAKTLLKDAEMLIQDGKILEIGTKLNRPANAVIKNLNGAHIYPAFIEAYSDFGVSVKKSGSSNQAVSTREGAFSWNEALRSDIKASQSFVYNPDEASKLREAGFACVHTHYADGISRGSSALALLNDKNEHESLLKNELCHMMSFQKGNSSQDYPGSLMGSIALLRQAYYDGRQYLTTIKPKETNLSIEAWNQLMNLPTIFSVTDKLDLLRAAAIAKEFNTQYIYKTAGDEYQRIQEIKQLNSPLIVPMVFPELFDVTDPYDALQIDLADLKHWEMAPSNAAILEKNGLKFCLSASGQKDVKSFLSKVKKAIQHGLSQEYALNALTLGPAELLKVNDMVGTLHKGKLANFIVSPTELFDEQGKINATWVQGKEFSYATPTLNLVAGEYELELGEERIKLEFQNNTASNNEWKIVSKDSNTDIQAKFQPDYLNGKWIKKSKEVLLFSASKTGNDWIGKAFNSQGEWKDFVIRFKAIKQVDRVADNSSAKTSISTGSLWYPNMAYGWTEKPKAKTYLIKNTTVWTCEQAGILSNTDVLISDGKIKSIGKSIAAPEAIVIDGTNKHLTPGIIDEHSHIAISKGVNECTQASTAEVRIADVVNCDDINIYRQLSGGVTTSHLLHGSCNPIGGQTTLIKLRWGSSPDVGGEEQGRAGDVIADPHLRPRLTGGEDVLELLGFAAMGERREDEAGQDGVDADPVLREFHRRALGEADHRGLGGGVDDRPRIPRQARDRRGVDDYTAVALLLEYARAVLHAEKHALGQHVEGVVERLDRDLGDGADGTADAGIVEQDVEATEVVERAFQHRFDVSFLGDVGLDEARALAMALGFSHLHGLGAGLRVVIGDHDIRAFGEETQHGRASHATCTTGDDGSLAFESHVWLPLQ